MGMAILVTVDQSVWQMVSTTQVIFALVFSCFILKRSRFAYMWWSSVVTAIGVGICGFSFFASEIPTSDGLTPARIALGAFLSLVSNALTAGEATCWDFLMHSHRVDSNLIVGLKGAYGCAISAVALPILWLTKAEEVPFRAIADNPTLLGFVIAHVITIFAFNVSLMMLNNAFGAVVQTSFQPLRSLCLWVVALVLQVAVRDSEFGRQHPGIGEELSPWSVLRLMGFLLSILGILMLNGVLKMPCFAYPRPMPTGSGMISETSVWMPGSTQISVDHAGRVVELTSPLMP
jgi:hypothetical protein